MKTLKIVISFILINFTLILAANPDENGCDFKVSKYNITVALSCKFDKLSISAMLDIVNVNKQNQMLPLQLCEGFNIVKPKNIVVMDANDTYLESTEKSNIIYIKLPDYLAKKDSFKVVVLYDLVKTGEYKNDSRSKFVFDISENVTHINTSVKRIEN